jgi:Cysteine rich repeat
MTRSSLLQRCALLAVLLAPLLAPGGPAAAQGDAPSATAPAAPATPPRAKPRGACRDDIEHLCAGIQPGGGRLLACLREHTADVSPGCQAMMQRARPAQGDAAPAK